MTDAFPADPFAAFSDRLAALTAEAAARVVAVHGRDGRARSGLLWAEGLVVTAEEALERDDELSLTLPDGRMVPATLAGRDPGTDVALLKAATGAFAPLAAAPPAALATGHPGAGGRPRRIRARRGLRPRRPWSAAPGGRCAAAGWTGASSSACGSTRAPRAARCWTMPGGWSAWPCPARAAGRWPSRPRPSPRSVEQLRTRGRVARGYLGLAMQPVQLGEVRGLIVVGVDPRSPAGQAGVLLGDVLAAWDGAPLGSVRDMLARLDPDSVGTTVTLELDPRRPAASRAGPDRRTGGGMTMVALADLPLKPPRAASPARARPRRSRSRCGRRTRTAPPGWRRCPACASSPTPPWPMCW